MNPMAKKKHTHTYGSEGEKKTDMEIQIRNIHHLSKLNFELDL